jgi:hypothetical protein
MRELESLPVKGPIGMLDPVAGVWVSRTWNSGVDNAGLPLSFQK